MFGRKSKLPIDAVFQSLEEPNNKTTKEYMKERITRTQAIVHKYTEKARNKPKTYLDKKAKAAKISKGDRVLVKLLVHQGKHKLADKFEDEVYTVVEEVNGMPVYKIKQESSGTIRTLHRNHLDLVSHIDNRKEQNSVNDNQETEEKEHAV